MTTDLARIQIRRGTAAAWTAANPVLLMGELGLETDTKVQKTGDGVTAWVSLPSSQSSTYAAAFVVDAAFGDGVTDATAHIQSKINAAGGGVGGNLGGKVVLPPGKYLLTAPLTWNPNTWSATQQLALPGPSIVGAGGLPGRIGDNTNDTSAVTFICKPGVFPSGQYVIDYTTPNTAFTRPGGIGAISGVLMENFAIQGNNLGAGIRLSTGRRCKIANVNTMNTAAPAPTVPSASGGDDGAFTLVWNLDNASAAYNIIENCCAYSAGRDSFVINDGSNVKVIGCYSLSPARYGFYLGIEQTAIGCHNELSGVADFYMFSTNTSVIGTEFYFRPHQSNVIIAGYNQRSEGSAKLIGCSFIGCDDVSSPATQAMVHVIDYGAQPVSALISGCTFFAGLTTSAFVHVDAGVTGTVAVRGSTFTGTPSVAPYVLNGFTGFTTDDGLSPVGELPISAVTVMTAANIGRTHACTVAAAYTLTLPTPANYTGRQIGVRVTPGSTNLLTLATASGNIDGQATRIMWAGETATLQSDGTNWVKVTGKTIPMTCAMYANAAQSIPNGAMTTILLDTARQDSTGLMATVATNRVTIRRPGIYSLVARIGLTAAPANTPRLLLNVSKNGATAVIQIEQNAVLNQFPTFTGADDVTFVAGDYLLLQTYQNSNSAWNTLATAATNDCQITAREVPTW